MGYEVKLQKTIFFQSHQFKLNCMTPCMLFIPFFCRDALGNYRTQVQQNCYQSMNKYVIFNQFHRLYIFCKLLNKIISQMFTRLVCTVAHMSGAYFRV